MQKNLQGEMSLIHDRRKLARLGAQGFLVQLKRNTLQVLGDQGLLTGGFESGLHAEYVPKLLGDCVNCLASKDVTAGLVDTAVSGVISRIGTEHR